MFIHHMILRVMSIYVNLSCVFLKAVKATCLRVFSHFVSLLVLLTWLRCFALNSLSRLHSPIYSVKSPTAFSLFTAFNPLKNLSISSLSASSPKSQDPRLSTYESKWRIMSILSCSSYCLKDRWRSSHLSSKNSIQSSAFCDPLF